MSEFIHPPIDVSIERDISIEQDFAERAYEILNVYQVACQEPQGDYMVTYPVTDRVDVVPEEDSDVELALRLIRRQVRQCVSSPEIPLTAGGGAEYDAGSNEIMVIELQYGTLDPDEHDPSEPIVVEDFTWRPYVQAVITNKTGEACVLDPNTGKELPVGDVLKAGYFLELLRSELRGMVYEAATPVDDDIPVTYERITDEFDPNSYKDIEMEDLDLNYACELCGAQNSVCPHNIPKMN